MKCNYLDHGVVISSNKIVSPCCNFSLSQKWIDENNIDNLEIVNWHKKDQFTELKRLFEKNIFPKECIRCEITESLNREDSLRKNFNNITKNSKKDDIFLEITPGTTCNLACFSCIPESSSKIRFYHKKLQQEFLSKNIDLKDFSFLEKVKDRIKQITLLGGESFYDKNCINFLNWASKNLNCKIIIYTNGSNINYEILSKLKNCNLIFSIDAVDSDAEYIRNGCDWSEVKKNYLTCRDLKNISTFVQITESVYSIATLDKLLDFLLNFYPDVLMISIAYQPRNYIDLIPIPLRTEIQEKLKITLKKVQKSNLEKYEKIKILKIIKSIDNRLSNLPWNKNSYKLFCEYTNKMNSVIKPKTTTDFIDKLLKYVE